MKRSTLYLQLLGCLICLMPTTFLTSQDYVPVAMENATWVIGTAVDGWDDIDYHGYKIEGDTIMEGVLYKKVYRYSMESNQQNPYVITDRSFAGVVRDDVDARKVYGTPGYMNDVCYEMYIADDPIEILLMDFSKTIGDTMTDCSLDLEFTTEDIYYEITSDSLENHYGFDRRTISSYDMKLIEGIGYDDGLFNIQTPFFHAGYGSLLSTYCIGTNFECGLITSTDQLDFEGRVRISPNPVGSSLNIDTDFSIDYIWIYNQIGRLVLGQSFEYSIDVDHFAQGMYMIKLRTSSQDHLTMKMFKS